MRTEHKIEKQKYEYIKKGDWVQDSDQYRDPADGVWKPTFAVGRKVNYPRFYRRPIPEWKIIIKKERKMKKQRQQNDFSYHQESGQRTEWWDVVQHGNGTWSASYSKGVIYHKEIGFETRKAGIKYLEKKCDLPIKRK